MRTETELKAAAFDKYIKASKAKAITVRTEQGRAWIVSAATLQAIYQAEKVIDNNKDKGIN